MDETHVPAAAPLVGYSREMVDEFLAASAVEQERLRAQIDDAKRRAAEARAAVSTHEVMLTMILETHRELAQRRNDAEHEAAELLDEAEQRAREILRAAHRDRGPQATDDATSTHDELTSSADIDASVAEPSVAEPSVAEPSVVEPAPIDLSELELLERRAAVGMPVSVGAASAAAPDGYFDFLRGALVDDEPLGPRQDSRS